MLLTTQTKSMIKTPKHQPSATHIAKVTALAMAVGLLLSSCTGKTGTDVTKPDNPTPVPPTTSEQVPISTTAVTTADSAQDGPDSGVEMNDSAYTIDVVEAAIDLYSSKGREEALSYYSDPANIDGQWYVFIVDADTGEVLAHYDPERIGARLDSWVGTDANGYEFGSSMMEAGLEGKWVTYVFANPSTTDIKLGHIAETQLKIAWVQEHDDLIFGSGYYIDATTFVTSATNASIASYNAGGLEGYEAQFEMPDSVLAGVVYALQYYNTDSFEGRWIVFVSDANGEVLSSYFDPHLVGTNITDLLGTAVLNASPDDGVWVTEDLNDPGTGPSFLQAWIVSHDDLIFGAARYG